MEYPENWHVVFCPNKYRYFGLFLFLDQEVKGPGHSKLALSIENVADSHFEKAWAATAISLGFLIIFFV